jgi:hypothetical protein
MVYVVNLPVAAVSVMQGGSVKQIRYLFALPYYL